MDNKIEIPKHLLSTYKMIRSCFPEGIIQKYYYPLMTLLYDYMSNRNLADIMSICTGKDWGITYNDALLVGSVSNPVTKEELNEVKSMLLKHGYEEWIKEE